MHKLTITAAAVVTALSSQAALADTYGQKGAHAHGNAAAMEQRIQQLENALRSMQGEMTQLRGTSGEVAKLEEKVETLGSSGGGSGEKRHMVFFRGGYARNDHDRYGDILTDANADNSGGAATNIAGLGVSTSDLTGNKANGDRDAWYFGAGFDFSLTDDFWGLVPSTEVLAELQFEYKEFDAQDLNRAPLGTAANDSVNAAAGTAGEFNGALPTSPVCATNATNPGGSSGLIQNNAGPYGSCSNSVHVTQFTLSASPKIKFMKGSKLRPWIIPIGMAVHVISPPSDGVTVLAPGMVFAAGADYNLWSDIYVGLDARYHLVDNATDGVNLDGLTAGGYLGIGF